MIARRYARKLLDEYLGLIEKAEAAKPDGELLEESEVRALAVELLDESPLVIRGVESAEQKGKRYLTEGRLRIERMEPSGLIVASCRGSGATYSLGYDPVRRQWRCTCAVERGGKRTRRCSHLAGLQLVVDEPKEER